MLGFIVGWGKGGVWMEVRIEGNYITHHQGHEEL